MVLFDILDKQDKSSDYTISRQLLMWILKENMQNLMKHNACIRSGKIFQMDFIGKEMQQRYSSTYFSGMNI